MTRAAASAVTALPDLFESETLALERVRQALACPTADAAMYRESLVEIMLHFERLMRETRRLIGRSDRAEREMNVLNLQLSSLAKQLEYRATHDALTGVLNRGAIIDKSCETLKDQGAVMIVLDIDHFKRINDDYGHPAGDGVIKGIVQCLGAIVGEAGYVGRVGGEEFTVLMPAGTLEQGKALAEGMRAAIAAHGFGEPVNRQVTASFGVSANPAGTPFDFAYGAADEALYRAKRAGRNRVEWA